eukprot:TRINITY_DN10739_c0_g1_i1.p1 TRINITY_DN10739_c0_g1~~TRINITY_DN10739_c0_g1_i1.p1  ORF type:complete len:489 (+),score=104.32 TRINITY_DN10739_c0_g1_i1:257-1723(+)
MKLLLTFALLLTLALSQTYYIAPQSVGTGDGTSISDAATLSNLGSLLAKNPETIVILSDLGNYTVTSSIEVTKKSNIMTHIVGQNSNGERIPAIIVGSRANPWSSGLSNGATVFNLRTGTGNFIADNLKFYNIGNGAFYFKAEASNVILRNIEVYNSMRFVENEGEGDVVGLVIENCYSYGYSKGFARFAYASKNIIIKDCYGDAEHQIGDNFCMGIHLGGTVSNVSIIRTSMINCRQIKDSSLYWNGDGFASERDVTDLYFEDTYASGHTDGGYDLKSDKTVLVRAVGENNKRNFRTWGIIQCYDCVSIEPMKLGGIGSEAHIHSATVSVFDIYNSSFYGDKNRSNVLFHSEDTAVINVYDSIVCEDNYEEKRIESGSIHFFNVVEDCPVVITDDLTSDDYTSDDATQISDDPTHISDDVTKTTVSKITEANDDESEMTEVSDEEQLDSTSEDTSGEESANEESVENDDSSSATLCAAVAMILLSLY